MQAGRCRDGGCSHTHTYRSTPAWAVLTLGHALNHLHRIMMPWPTHADPTCTARHMGIIRWAQAVSSAAELILPCVRHMPLPVAGTCKGGLYHSWRCRVLTLCLCEPLITPCLATNLGTILDSRSTYRSSTTRADDYTTACKQKGV